MHLVKLQHYTVILWDLSKTVKHTEQVFFFINVAMSVRFWQQFKMSPLTLREKQL